MIVEDDSYSLDDIMNKWCSIRDKYMNELSAGKLVNYFDQSRMIERDELEEFKIIVFSEEARILARICRVKSNELCHLEDELSDR